ncbi:MAG: ABC transporter ATP-binding protein/permease [Lachnospiraceae bacterium]|nr:ABC transporter ATP-binding protein/permease [Lachnospiraceae bacterium]
MDNMRSFLSTIGFCIRLSWESSRLYTVLRLFIYLTNAIIPLISIYASKVFIDILVQAGHVARPFHEAVFWLIIICGITISVAVTNRLLQYIQDIHIELMNNRIQVGLMEKSMSVDMDFFDSPDYIDSMQATMMDSFALPNIVWNIFAGFSSLISFTSAFIMLGTVNWLYPLILTAAAFPSAISNQRYTKLLYGWRLSHINEDRKMGYIQSLASNKTFANDIRLFNLREFLVGRYQDIWTLLIMGRKKLLKRQLFAALSASLLPEAIIFIILILVTRNIFDGRNTVGDYTLYSGLLATLAGSLTYAINSIVNIYEDKLKVDTIKKFESRANSVLDNGTKELSGDLDIEFKDVSFKYPGTERLILNGLSFRIAPKEKICLIGINGAGKSTIIKLLLRFYDVSNGNIIINGNDIREYSLSSLRRCFSTFFQQYDKYAFSLRDNVIISDLEKQASDDKRAIETLEKVDALGLLKKAAKGLDTPLSRYFDPDGIELSGGEEQKIALARTVYRSCQMIIFDEPSSSLDPISEMNLFENMKELFKGKSALFTSHRLSIVHLSDHILILEDGHITESGSHKELMELGGEYSKLYTLQSKKYEV